LVCLGGFKNLRQDYNYEGLKMELDETSYEWGTCYEIEIETVSVSEQLPGCVAACFRCKDHLLLMMLMMWSTSRHTGSLHLQSSQKSQMWVCLAQLYVLCVFMVLCGCLQEDPEPTKAKLEKFLESKGIPCKYGTKTKFANFRQRTLE